MILDRMLRLSEPELSNKKESQVQQESLGNKGSFEGGVNKNKQDIAHIAEDKKESH